MAANIHSSVRFMEEAYVTLLNLQQLRWKQQKVSLSRVGRDRKRNGSVRKSLAFLFLKISVTKCYKDGFFPRNRDLKVNPKPTSCQDGMEYRTSSGKEIAVGQVSTFSCFLQRKQKHKKMRKIILLVPLCHKEANQGPKDGWSQVRLFAAQSSAHRSAL